MLFPPDGGRNFVLSVLVNNTHKMLIQCSKRYRSKLVSEYLFPVSLSLGKGMLHIRHAILGKEVICRMRMLSVQNLLPSFANFPLKRP